MRGRLILLHGWLRPAELRLLLILLSARRLLRELLLRGRLLRRLCPTELRLLLGWRLLLLLRSAL